MLVHDQIRRSILFHNCLCCKDKDQLRYKLQCATHRRDYYPSVVSPSPGAHSIWRPVWDSGWGLRALLLFSSLLSLFSGLLEKAPGLLTWKSRWCRLDGLCHKPFAGTSFCGPMPRHPPASCPSLQMSSVFSSPPAPPVHPTCWLST